MISCESLCHSEQSEESEFEITILLPKNQILRFAQNDKTSFLTSKRLSQEV